MKSWSLNLLKPSGPALTFTDRLFCTSDVLEKELVIKGIMHKLGIDLKKAHDSVMNEGGLM